MNLSGNQRKAYVLSVVLLALTVIVCGAWGMWRSSLSTGGTPAATGSPEPAPTAEADLTATGSPAPAGAVRTTVYYQDNYGYLVPSRARSPRSRASPRRRSPSWSRAPTTTWRRPAWAFAR